MHSNNVTTCLGCGAVAAVGTKFCGQCGQSLDPSAALASRAPQRPRWYYNVWFTLFMLFFVLGPFGLPLVWKNPRFSQGVKIILTLVMVVYTIALVELTMQAIQAVMGQVNQLNSTLSF